MPEAVDPFVNATADWRRLGKEVVNRRVELGFNTREKFAVHAQISSRILCDIENGKRSSYDRATLVKLERAAGWDYGSVDSVLVGGVPNQLSTPRARTSRTPRPVIQVDPAVRFGRPQIRGIPTDAIADTLYAGESAESICDEYDLTRYELLVALWYEASSGDYANHPDWKQWAAETAYPALAGWAALGVESMPLPPSRFEAPVTQAPAPPTPP